MHPWYKLVNGLLSPNTRANQLPMHRKVVLIGNLVLFDTYPFAASYSQASYKAQRSREQKNRLAGSGEKLSSAMLFISLSVFVLTPMLNQVDVKKPEIFFHSATLHWSERGMRSLN